MKKGLTKFAALFFILCLCAASCGIQVQAKVYRGKWRRESDWKLTLNWEYDSRTKRLTISGKGKMARANAEDEVIPASPGWRKFEESIKEIVIKEGVTNVGAEMVWKADSLTSVKMADSVREIEAFCVYGAKKLKKISFPPHLEKIGGGAFDSSGLREVTIPSTVKKIGSFAFSMCESLRKVTIQSGMTKLGEGSFYYCTKLKEVILPEDLKVLGDCFGCCSNLRTVSLPKSLRKLKARCFAFTPLRNVTIPENVEEIGKEAFCLKEGDLGKGLTCRRIVIKSTKIKRFGKNIFGKGNQFLLIEVPESKLEEYREELYAKGLPKYAQVVAHKK